LKKQAIGSRATLLAGTLLTFILFFVIGCNPKPATGSEPVADNKKPDETRFTPVVLTAEGDFDEPMNFEVLKNGDVFINERKGVLKLYDHLTKLTKIAGTIPVNTKYTSAAGVVSEAEEGFIGFTIDPKFEENHWAYLYYAHPTEKKHVLSRWIILDGKLQVGSEKILLEVGTQREVCCHTGGGMTWDANGNLYLTVGNNTGNVADKSQTDERVGRSSWDDQRGAGNTNDLRGKILRIHPEADGSYTIPEGNLFPKGTAKTRPEIFVMGDRNPWRPSVDSKTGWLYWGEVGPDASADTKTTRTGMDELNQARKAGNFGWPYFIGENRGYPMYNYSNDSVGPENNPAKPINNSVNNTGLKELPPAQPAFISYPYGVSEKFPEVGTSSRCAVGGPIYHATDFKNPERPFPAYYEGKWIAADLSRGWIMSITMNEKGDYQSMERFLPSYQPIEPIDIKFGSNGDLYVLEYGSNWFRKSENAKLVRIQYNAGNRTPIVAASASASGGALPFKVQLSAAGTKDSDGDSLQYEWNIVSAAGGNPQVFHEPNPSLTLTQPGLYTATLTVKDPQGAKNSKTLSLVAGNEAPMIDMTVTGNQYFFFPGKPIEYKVGVSDKEDGKIDPATVAISADYVSDGFDYAEINQQQRSVDASTRFAVAQTLMAKSDCNNCHHADTKSVGPMLNEIAEKYKTKLSWALDSLPKKIRTGGVGVWGTVSMPAHPAITLNDARNIVNYILHSQEKTISTLPMQGKYTQTLSPEEHGNGSLILRAAYTDKGANTIPALSSEKIMLLHSPTLNAAKADIIKDAEIKKQIMFMVSLNVIPKNNGYIAYNKIDFTGIKELEINASANPSMGFVGGTIEIRQDAPDGVLLGQAEVKPYNPFAAMMSAANATQNAGGNKKPGAAPAPKPAAAPKKPGMPLDLAKLFATAGLVIPLKETSGQHNLFLVFKNDKVKPADPLLSFSEIKVSDHVTPSKPAGK
jgi:cytochrome c